MGLTHSEIRSLYASGARGSRIKGSTGYYFTLGEVDSDGISRLVRNSGKPKNPSFALGAYEGKVGSVRRSRKGVPRRQPNGWRRYNAGDLAEDLTSVVVAYKV